MFLPVLKRSAIIIFIIVLALFAAAQPTRFIYLQTENGQPFYVKINNKIISSSPAGYLILPKLTDGDYRLNVGFPKREFPEENFQVLIDKKNEGFLLKNFGEKGWGLFNMQSYGIVMGGNTTVLATSSKNTQDDQFSKLLANVVKDSSILQKKEVVAEAPKEPAKEEVKKQPVTGDAIKAPVIEEAKKEPAKEEVKNEAVKSEPLKEEVPVSQKSDSSAKFDSLVAKADSTNANVDSTIALIEKARQSQLLPPTRFLSKKNKDGREMIYVDHNQDINDTIRIFIPSAKLIKAANATTDTAAIQNVQQPQAVLARADTSSPIVEQKVPQDKKDTSVAVSPVKENVVEKKDTMSMASVDAAKQQPEEARHGDSVATVPLNRDAAKNGDIVVLPKVVQSSSTNSDCKAFASNEDFLKVRKKMASENSDDNMVKTAKKVFHSKCFSTEQIKDLSFLFLTNAGKYMFFDMAYPFASDSDQYGTLESQLTDGYYINRFKAMIHK